MSHLTTITDSATSNINYLGVHQFSLFSFFLSDSEMHKILDYLQNTKVDCFDLVQLREK